MLYWAEPYSFLWTTTIHWTNVWSWSRQTRQRTKRKSKAWTWGRVKQHIIELGRQVAFILFYFRVCPVQEVQGYIFGLGQTQAGKWIHRLTPILDQTVGCKKQLPARKARDVAKVLQIVPWVGIYYWRNRATHPPPKEHTTARKKTPHGQKQCCHRKTHKKSKCSENYLRRQKA